MTSNLKTRGSGSQRRPLDPEERFQRRVTLGFIALTIAVIAIIVVGIAYGYWDQHLKPVASVNGAGISKDQWADRARLEGFRLERQDRRLTEALAAGEMTPEEADQFRASIQQAQQDVPSSAIENLIDLTLQGQLADQQDLSVTDAEVEQAVTEDATKPETRRVSVIIVEPEEDTREGRQTAYTQAHKAADELSAGKAFEEVAATYSTDASKADGGDIGVITRDAASDPSTGLDGSIVDAMFAAQTGAVTPLMTGSDGIHRIARVSEILPGALDPTYQDDLRDTMSWDAYRANIRIEALAGKLEDSVVAQATTGDMAQVHPAEIWLEGDTTLEGEADSGKVSASHILYSPNDDPQAGLPEPDPSWIVAQAESGLASKELRAITDVEARKTAFADMARRQSDDTGSGANGGDLGFFTRDAMVPEFADALFDHLDTLKPGDIVGPVRSEFGWHVIMFQDSQPPLAQRVQDVQARLAAPDADFAAIATETSDGAEGVVGGDLGWRAEAQLPPDAASTILVQEVGAVSEPIALDDGTNQGYHIYKTLEQGARPLDEAQRATVAASAFDQWYEPQKETAEADGNITRDESIFESASDTE